VFRTTILTLVVALTAVACSSSPSSPEGFESPERTVVAWFEAIDDGDTVAAARAVNDDSLAVILSIENDIDDDTTAAYLESGVPSDVQRMYWESFASGFSDFASRPISTLTVGESRTVDIEGATYASVPISSGASSESIVFTRMRDDGTWEVDLVATLSDGFSSLLVDEYDHLGSTESAQAIRTAYVDVVAPAFLAAIAEGSFGDEFNRVALTLLGQIGN
jgi:hypothetical protein